jgi:outer membrane protein OmpA-like peptidoglycan-associated protein
MTVRFLATALLAMTGLLFGMPQRAHAEDAASGARAIQIAENDAKNNDDNDKDKKGQKGKQQNNKNDTGDKTGGRNKNGDKGAQGQGKNKGGAGTQNADKQKRLLDNQARQKALKDKLDAAKAAKDNADKQKQIQIQQAKDKALKDKLNAAKAAKDNADKQKQIQIQQAKDKALKDKLDADKTNKNNWTHKPDPTGKNGGGFAGTTGPFSKGKKGAVGAAKIDPKETDLEFNKARDGAKTGKFGTSGRKGTETYNEAKAKKFFDLRQKRTEKTAAGGARKFFTEPDKRTIVWDKDRLFIRHDETTRFQKSGRQLRRERQRDGSMLIVTMGLGGTLVFSFEDDHGRLLRRTRKGRDGRELVLIDNRNYYRRHPWRAYGEPDYYDAYVDLPPPVVNIPREKYIVDYDGASVDDIYEALDAPPVEPLDRGYSLDEVRQSYDLLERMRRVDLSDITFEFGSWDVADSQFPKLERMAKAIQRILDRSPDEMFLIEGHTDAVGSDIDNLSLSDRRAESVAVVLTEEFGIPPENLTTQGYGEQYLKEDTEEPSLINRRVAVRRITPLLDRQYSER